ncbi:hypothetical protein PsYK624_118130 [Phanerochaete sordida]|uniref:Uncharacterized protein n=1 Tax=Phanerochaete sordida TaxID=48140 RepID=A0A9P3GIC6_9APHY|nr:hypothetical protein PsYK624_118130 [Phanerochaete sordida]
MASFPTSIRSSNPRFTWHLSCMIYVLKVPASVSRGRCAFQRNLFSTAKTRGLDASEGNGSPAKFSLPTLDYRKLTPECHIDLSTQVQRQLKLTQDITQSLEPFQRAPSCSTTISFGAPYPWWRNLQFPPGTSGFLYFQPPHEGLHPLSGQVRFRVTSSASPSSFASGHDLLQPHGMPWAVRLLPLEGAAPPLSALLVRDGLLAPDALAQCDVLTQAMDADPQRRPRELLCAFGQPFALRLKRQGRTDVLDGPLETWLLGAVKGKTVVRHVVHEPDREQWAFRVKGGPTIKAFTAPGIVAASFEVSTLRQHLRYLWQKPIIVRVHGVALPDGSPHPDHDAAAGGLLCILGNTKRQTRRVLTFENNPAMRGPYNALRLLAHLPPEDTT